MFPMCMTRYGRRMLCRCLFCADDWPWPETDMHGAEQHPSIDTEAAPADMGPGFDADDDNDDGSEPLEPMDVPGNEDMTQRQSGNSSVILTFQHQQHSVSFYRHREIAVGAAEDICASMHIYGWPAAPKRLHLRSALSLLVYLRAESSTVQQVLSRRKHDLRAEQRPGP